MNKSKITLEKMAACLLMTVLVAGCETTGFGTIGGSQNEKRAESLAMSGRHADAAGIYIGMATQAMGAERDRLTLLAVEQWLDAGDGRRARNALGGVSKPQQGELFWLWTTDSAALALWEGRPDEALLLLDPLSQQAIPVRHRSRAEALRADAWLQKREPVRAINLYMQRESWLDDPAAVTRNRQRLWAGLLVSDTDVLRRAADVSSDPLIRGWLTLAVLANTTGQQGIGWSNGIANWQQNYANHPAIDVLTDLSLPDDAPQNYPRQVALLLPLSGGNAAAGNAIKNGFLGAHFSAGAGPDRQQQIRVYDVVDSGSAPQAYTQAVADGADFVVGPLIRSSVTELARQLILPVPILTLNYLADDVPAPPGLYQFALSPEDEAASAAARAIDDGQRRAVAIVPGNDWGRRVLTSFASEFEALGGTLLDFRYYEPAVQDFAFEIEGLMALSQSVQRYQRLRANLGSPLQFDPRRRQDVDFVFLAADAKSGRLIKSQLKFHYSGELPVYSTSFIYSLDGRSDSDLNGVMFADTPWIISPPAWIAGYPDLYARYWPAEKRLTRLHAMGYDAYHLVGGLHAAQERPMEEIAGATGRLYLANDGRVHRKLAWAQFDNGRPVHLPDTAEFRRTIDEPDADSSQDWSNEWREIPLER
jgi:outer membrane PBP1 activator LpoA protein